LLLKLVACSYLFFHQKSTSYEVLFLGIIRESLAYEHLTFGNTLSNGNSRYGTTVDSLLHPVTLKIFLRDNFGFVVLKIHLKI